ncbi:DUF11 domain-containing protein [Pseudonocardia sp. ICBG1293]|uniref:DUF11 domain-containing protein n=1 Tax=Pseudonocardia sp. ICBG1293 TaxID=2844382 RepID=UPI001CCBE817|nr:DUF11 domain-containing protein [Pseudonocardia sp. ICBG1293]
MGRRLGERGARVGGRRLASAALVAAVGFVPLATGTAAAADGVRVGRDQIPVCVATASPTGYCAAVRDAGTATVVDDERARTGRGYLRLDTPGGNDKVTVYAQAFAGRKLSDITDLEYSTLVEQGNGTRQVPALNIPVNPNKAGSTFTTLVFEPVYTATTPRQDGTWQTWPASSTGGGWWASGTDPVTGVSNKYGFDSYTADFAAVKAALPDAVVVGGIAVNQGSGNPGLRSGVDDLRIDGTTIDFDNPVLPTALAATGGDGQSTPVRTAFARPLSVALTGAGAAPVAGQVVTFTVGNGSAAFPGGATATATTGADGVATSPALSAGDTAGPVTVTATAGALSTTFALTVTPAPVVAREADLSVALGVPGTLKAGTTAPVTVTLRNAGPAAATRVTGAVTLPQGLRATSAPGGIVGGKGRSVAYLVPGIAAGTASTFTITVTADRTVTGPRTLEGAVAPSSVRDPKLANNATRVTTTVVR